MPLSLKLSDSSVAIVDVCRALEQALSSVSELDGLTLSVDLMANFDEVPEAKTNRTVRRTYAGYRDSTKTISVNGRSFLTLLPNVQQAVLAHELAHALAHSPSGYQMLAPYSLLGPYGEEFFADRLACKWGFLEGLCIDRIKERGQEYVVALRLWENEADYCNAMSKWHCQSLAGIIKKPV